MYTSLIEYSNTTMIEHLIFPFYQSYLRIVQFSVFFKSKVLFYWAFYVSGHLKVIHYITIL